MIKELSKYQMKNAQLYLIDMYASWCGPCKTQSLILDKLFVEEKRAIIIKIDVESDMALTRELKIMGVPSLVFVRDKKVLWKKPGLVEKEELKKVIDEIY
jgi:thioredoxin 1